MNTNDKIRILETQILSRGIFDKFLINAFLSVDLDDFIPHKYKRNCYIDKDLKFEENCFILRTHYLARIINNILKHTTNFNKTDILVIDDFTGYTSSILSNIFDNVYISTPDKSVIENIHKNDSNLRIIQDVSEIHKQFDMILCVSRIYNFEDESIKYYDDILKNDGSIFFIMENNEYINLDISPRIIRTNFTRRHNKTNIFEFSLDITNY